MRIRWWWFEVIVGEIFLFFLFCIFKYLFIIIIFGDVASMSTYGGVVIATSSKLTKNSNGHNGRVQVR